MSRTMRGLGSIFAAMSWATRLTTAAVIGLFVLGSMLTGLENASAQPADPPPAPSVPLDDPLDPTAGSTPSAAAEAPSGAAGSGAVQEKLEAAKQQSAGDTERFDGDTSNKVVVINGVGANVSPEQAQLIRAYFSRQISLSSLASADPGVAHMLREGALELVDAAELNPNRSSSETTDPTSPIGRANSLSSITSAVDSCQYLTFCRWKSVNAVPSADVSLTSMSQAPLAVAATFSSFVFTIAGLIFYVMGVGLILIVSVDILSNAIYLIDFMFGSITTQILGMDGNPSGALGVIFVIAIALVAIKVVTPGGSSLNLGLKSLAITFISVGVFAVMAYQSTKNHPSLAPDGVGTSGVAEAVEYSGDDDKIGNLPAEGEYKAPSEWAAFSPGWTVSAAASLATHVGGVVTEATDKVADSVNSTFSKSGLSSCDLYTAGMRASFLKTAAAEKMGGQANVLVSFDRLVGSLYFRNFQLAAFGNSQGAENAWCRVAETQAKIAPADQIMVARVSGLYSEIIGVGSMGVIKETNSAIVNPLHVSESSGISVTPAAGTYLNADGSWTAPKSTTAGEGQTVEDTAISCQARDAANAVVSVITIGLADVSCDDLEVNTTTENQAGSIGTSGANAMNIFGYAFRSQEASREFSSYWAACNWLSKGDGVGKLELNPEWEHVKQANSDRNLQLEDCVNPLIIDNADKQGFGMSAADGADLAKPVQVFNYTEKAETDSELWSVVSSFLGVGGSSSAIGKFSNATLGDGTNRALDYYMFTTGANNIQGSLFSVVSGAMALMTAKYFTPLVGGALFAQALAVGGLTLLAFLMLLLIFPSDRTRKSMRAALKTIAAALLSSSILAAFFGLAFALTTLFTNLLWNNMPEAILMQAIISGLGAFLAFKLLNMGLKKAMGDQMDMTSWSSGITAGMGAAAPAFQYLGFQDVMSPLDWDFWSSGRADEEVRHPDVLNDATTTGWSTGGDEDPVSDRHRRHSDLDSLTATPAKSEFTGAAEGVDAAAAAQGGLDPANDAAAVVMTAAAFAARAKHRAAAKLTGFAQDAEHIITAPIKDGMEVGRGLTHPWRGTMDPTVAAQMMENAVPFRPKLNREAFARAGIMMPSPENYEEYIQRLPGIRSTAHQQERGAGESLFDSHTIAAVTGQNMTGTDSSNVTTNPIATMGMSAWVANAHGMIHRNQMAAIEQISRSQEASVDDLRKWGAESGLLKGADFHAAPIDQLSNTLDRHSSQISEIVSVAISTADRNLTVSVSGAIDRRADALAGVFANAATNPAPNQISAATWDSFNEVRASFIDSISRSAANTAEVIENWGSSQAQQLSTAIENLNDELGQTIQSAVQSSVGESETQVRASFDSVISRIRGLHG